MQVLSRSGGSVPLVVPSSSNALQARRASPVHLPADGRKPVVLQHFNLRCYRLSSSTCFARTRYVFEVGRQPPRLRRIVVQALTANNDPSSGDAVGSSAHATNLSSGVEDWKPFFVSSLEGLQDGLRKMKGRGLLQTAKEGLNEACANFKNVDGKLVFEDSISRMGRQGARSWQALEPWIKWPLAIFATAYLAVMTTFGLVVAQDLLPLWILGPLFTGLIIRGVYCAIDFTRKCVANSVPLRQAVIRGTVQLYKDARNGELFDKLRVLISLKSKEFKEHLGKKLSDFVEYVKSGQAAIDLKDLMLLVLSALYEWTTENYENFVEWIRPFWRAFTRLMKKLF